MISTAPLHQDDREAKHLLDSEDIIHSGSGRNRYHASDLD